MTGLRALVFALLSGAAFGTGLLTSGMTRPDRVVGFLDFFGDWDPSLAFVMLGAVGVYFVLSRLVLKRRAPIYSPNFSLPTRREIDASLLGGAALFGAGWGLAGYCPGPALTSLAGWAPQALVFVASMLVGFMLNQAVAALRTRRQPQTPVSEAS